MIDFEEKILTYAFKVVVVGCFGWLLRDSYRRPTRKEVSEEIDTKLNQKQELLNEKFNNIKEDMVEIKMDIKELLRK